MVSASDSEALSALMQVRSSTLYGDETVFEEILRRVVAIQHLSVGRLVEEKGMVDALAVTKKLDAEVRKVVAERGGELGSPP